MKRPERIHQSVRSADLLGKVLRRWRKQRRWTQRQLGEEAGVRQETVSRVENGSAGTELKTVLRLCSALGIEMIMAAKPNRAEL